MKPDDIWQQVALGIVICGMQQQPLTGPWRGMYPDAFSLVRGDEEYTWWLNPNLIGLNTFELAGIPLDITTTNIEGSKITVTSGATVNSAEATTNGLKLTSHTPPATQLFDHQRIAQAHERHRRRKHQSESSDLETIGEGWSWLPDLNLLLIKAQHNREIINIEIE